MMRRTMLAAALALALQLGALSAAWCHASKDNARLPVVGAAPPFALTTAAGTRLSLAELRGKVLALTFIYASCTDTCPLLMFKLVTIAKRLGADFGPRVVFVAITVDPEKDTPEVLRNYATAMGADDAGWRLLSGSKAEVSQVLRRHGVFTRKNASGDVDHLFLTSLIDRQGRLRVQYLGVRFDPAEMQADLQKLLRE